MPTQLQLEGPDLESLLTRVKSELGPTARIVRAEKVRTGGIAGFFAKQRFEISVEVGDEQVTPAPPGPMSLLDLADQVSSTEQLGLSLRHTDQSRTPVAGVTAPPAPVPAVRTPEPVAAAPFSSPQPPVADDTTFAAVLASMQTSNGVGPAAIPVLAAPAAAPAPALATAPAPAPAPAAEVPAAAAPPVEVTAAVERSSTHVSTEGSTFAALVAHLEATAGATTPASAVPPATAPAVPQFLEPTAADGIVVTIPAARAPESVPLPVHLPFGRAPVTTSVHGQLARLGLPAHLQPFGPDDAVYSTLLKSLRSLPKAPVPTNRPGTVLAVVGPLPQALEAARALARELKLQPASAVVLATSRRTLTDLPERQVLRDIDQAELRRVSWRRKQNTTIVAVDAPMTAAGAVQARAYLTALEPSATWGAVEATRKPLDVGAFARAVGGFDALTLSAVDETSDPAAVLELGIPVARLGEQPATPSAWAALLTGRLAA